MAMEVCANLCYNMHEGEDMQNITKESVARSYLEYALLRCPILQPYIKSNDKTPVWDGEIFVYKGKKKKKDELYGTVRVQVKGISTGRLNEKNPSFSVNTSDLAVYQQSGGTILFVVAVDETGFSKIFYRALLPFDIKRILNVNSKAKSKSVEVFEFPEDEPDEMANVL